MKPLYLRSGHTRRLIVDLDAFDKTWARAGGWGIVALPATESARNVRSNALSRAVMDIERTGGLTTARDAYRAVLTRVPNNRAALFGFANVSQRLGKLTTQRLRTARCSSTIRRSPVC